MMIGRQIVLDTETTGLETSKGHKLIEIGCLEMINRRVTGRTFHTYLDPLREVDPGAFAVSGLSNEFLKGKPQFHEVVDEFLAFIQDAELIIHNAPFDIGFINFELGLLKHAFGIIDDRVQVIDTLLLARQLHPGQKNNLDALCRRYGVDNSHRNYHGALLDADILAKVYLKMTAGQSMLTLEDEVPHVLGKRNTMSKKRYNRPPNTTIKVIHANEEELRLHAMRMKRLEEKIN